MAVKKTEEAKTAEVKTEAKKPAAEKKAPAAKKPAAAKKAPAKKTAAAEKKVVTKVQFADKEYDVDEIVAAVKADAKAKKAGTVKTLSVYVKPEEAAAYYVVNDGKFCDKVDL